MEHSIFSANLPYPSLAAIQPNEQDLHCIRNDYAGQISELSAITQYVYHQLLAKEKAFATVGKDLLSIAMVEMRHLNILGGVLLRLGGNPTFTYEKDGHLIDWNSGLIDDCQQVKAMLLNDLRLEQETIACYKRQAQQVSQGAIADVLNRLVLDENCHVVVLQALLQGL